MDKLNLYLININLYRKSICLSNLKIILPSDKKFGLFFSLIFFVSSSFFIIKNNIFLSITFVVIALFFLITSFTYSKILHPLNKIWMNFGLLLSLVVRPIILGFVFFFIITPISLISKLFGRDELNIYSQNSNSFWKQRANKKNITLFKKQY